MTPSRVKQKKHAEGREPAVVYMAPFSAKAIVQFEDVPVTKTAKRLVRVINPSDEDIEVRFNRSLVVTLGNAYPYPLYLINLLVGQSHKGHEGGAQSQPRVDGAHCACTR